MRIPRPVLAFVIAVTTAATTTFVFANFTASQAREQDFYDLVDGTIAGRARHRVPWPADMVLVPIDAASQNDLGRWPWPRAQQARLLDRLHALGAKTIVMDFFASGKTTDADDDAFRSALARDDVALAVTGQYGQNGPAPSDAFRAQLLPFHVAHPNLSPGDLGLSLDSFFRTAAANGHVWFPTTHEGTVRTHAPLLGIGDEGALPSLALAGALLHEGADVRAIRCTPSRLVLPDVSERQLWNNEQPIERPDPADLPPRIPARLVLASNGSAALPAHSLALVYLDVAGLDRVPAGRDRQGRTRDLPGGLLTAEAIRVIEGGNAFRIISLRAALLPLLLLALGVPLGGAPSGLRLGLRFGFVMIAWMAGAAFAFIWFNTMVPLVLPEVFLFASGLVFLIERVRRVEARADAGQAPTGEVTLVFSDIQDSTRLWEHENEAMREALTIHNRVLRETLAEARGYEVKTEGDSFMLSFPSTFAAVAFCLAAQRALRGANWPAALLERAEARVVRDDENRVSLRGPRVRMGVFAGRPEARVDPLTGRMDYFGPVVNRAARVAGAAEGGRTLVGAAAWDSIRNDAGKLPAHQARDLGEIVLKGLLAPERVVELTIAPEESAARARA